MHHASRPHADTASGLSLNTILWLAVKGLGYLETDHLTSLPGRVLRDRLQQWGVLSDLNESIKLYQAASLLHPLVYYDRSMYFDNLALSLRDRFQQQGSASDWGHRAPIELRCSYTPPVILVNPRLSTISPSSSSIELHYYVSSVTLIDPCLSAGFRDRPPQQYVPSDIDEAIELGGTALLFRPFGHPDRRVSLDNLAMRGVPSDLDEMFRIYPQLL
ncbi:uncharacterized protein F5147DRAFT_838096 [Suillus discolor]|uniref:Uncharacterized protein n=1 Tax=Suillus discolor TaxID=1912936 RepID=A0A9P7JS90_9AGAM|nr:uncharacterized protein F5147DRAFT_838096 [Suillus discolor]KAG2105494.1 hypothetical protein F5147DRAFT_838096 [Suillus discolor]